MTEQQLGHPPASDEYASSLVLSATTKERPVMSTKRPPQVNFTVNEETLALLEELKEKFGVETNTAVLRRALAIARLAAMNQRDDHTVSIIGKDDIRRDIVLNG
jgi:hypothetical protein